MDGILPLCTMLVSPSCYDVMSMCHPNCRRTGYLTSLLLRSTSLDASATVQSGASDISERTCSYTIIISQNEVKLQSLDRRTFVTYISKQRTSIPVTSFSACLTFPSTNTIISFGGFSAQRTLCFKTPPSHL